MTTPWIFHCEEDWEFYRVGFIEESLRILRLEPSYITVALRAHDDMNSQPIDAPRASASRPLMRLYKDIYSGFGFHPGLRRLVDYLKIAPFECAVSWPFYFLQESDWVLRFEYRAHENDVHMLFNKFGNLSVGAAAMEPAGYVRHTGAASPTPAGLPTRPSFSGAEEHHFDGIT